jgi:endonuclease/exonuclease/phosphatase family metal-dependent hydrolase
MDNLLPAAGPVTIELAEADVPQVEALGIERADRGDVRVLSHNIHYNRPIGDPGPFHRYLTALSPDLVNLQEVWLWDAEETKKFVTEILDPEKKTTWHVAKVEDCVTISRWPILETAAVDGNLISLIDLPENLSSNNLVLFNAHTPCCGHNDRRDYEHDHMAATWRDLLNGVGPFPIGKDTSVIMLGDFNMVGYARQLHSLKEGDIFDNQLFGPDFQPDRAVGFFRVAPLRHTHSRAIYSWRNDLERYPPGRLDYIFYGPSQAKLKNNFTLYTPDLPQDALDKYGLKKTDSLVSDHLVQVADFEFR